VSIVFAGTSTVLVTLRIATLAGGWSPAHLVGPLLALWWVSMAVAGVAVVLMGAALYPRTRGTGCSITPIAFYGDVEQFTDPRALRAALEQSAMCELEQLIDQLMRVSGIVGLKYRLLALSMWALLISALGCGLTMVL
jgi:hypothetical protein